MVDEDEEKFLDDALLVVKNQTFQLKNSIDTNKLRLCLKYSGAMLNELKTCLLGPRSYYHLYTTIFDEIQYLINYFREEARRGRKLTDLYDTVQQAGNIIPRIYLMICVASIEIESSQANAKDVIYDLLLMIKGVQNPLRGLFLRYFLLKTLKDKLPDVGNEYISSASTFDDTINFILLNLDEMNRLWIRLSTGCTGSDRTTKEKERNDLRILIGENLTRLSALNGMNLDLYKKEILPKVIEMILESKDSISQQYLMECIISAFPDEYNITCMNTLLDTCTKLQTSVDVKVIFISLMDKLARYVENNSSESNALSSAANIFSLLKTNIDKIVIEGSSGSMDNLKVLDLEVAFIKFTIKCCPEKDKLDTINHIFYSCVSLLTQNKNEKITQEGVKQVRNLLSPALDSTLSIFEMPNFPELMKYLDYSSRSSMSLRIIDALVNKKSFGKLDTSEKMSTLVDFIRPLLEDSPDAGEFNYLQFEFEQNSVARILFIVSCNEPYLMFDILSVLKTVFIKGGSKRMKFTLPSLINAYISLASGVSYAYAKANGYKDNIGGVIHQDYMNKYNLHHIDSIDSYEKFMNKIYLQINDTLTLIANEYAEIAFKLYLTVAIQVNDIKVERTHYEDICYNLLITALGIFQDGKLDKDRKVDLLNILIGTVLSFSILSKEKYAILNNNILQAITASLAKRRDQCVAILNCSHLFCNNILIDKGKITECLTKAKRFADFAMTMPQNAILFIFIINKYIYFIDKCQENTDFINTNNINDLLELAKNHIASMKLESADAPYVSQIDEYYKNTVKIIERRKQKERNKCLEQLLI